MGSWFPQGWQKNPLAPDYHATLWHTDTRTALGRPECWGTGFTATQPFGRHLVVFGRYGYSNGGAALLKHLVMGGIAYNGAFGWEQDTAGLAFGIGKPSAAGLETQFIAEFYSRMQIIKRLSLTPGIQLIANPSSNPQRDLLAVLGLRARITW